jgi:methionyl-tRNA formyltransferase
MKFNHIDKVILFGGAPLLAATARYLKESGTAVRIYTSPRHAAEPLDASGTTLAQTLESLRLPFVSTDDINTEKSLPAEITSGTLGLGIGEAWSFSPDIIKMFGGRLLDFMGIPHPRYRGGAHYTWMLLRDDRHGGCNLQVINEAMVQGEYDDGEIVKSRRYQFPASARTPLGYFAAAVPNEVAFIREFLDQVKAGKDFEYRKPDESQSLFLPRLHTLTHGWIDWSWSGRDIERFICAFDEPSAGASTRLGGVRVHLKGAALDESEEAFHPFQSGLVTRTTAEEGFVIATQSGHLKVKTITAARDERLPQPPQMGDRLFTPSVDLESALNVRVSYGSKT